MAYCRLYLEGGEPDARLPGHKDESLPDLGPDEPDSRRVRAVDSTFEAAFVRHMRNWTMEGKPRRARAYTPYTNSPLPTPWLACSSF
jgi:hypothetical protein